MKKEYLSKKEVKLESDSIQKKITKNSVETNYKIDLIKGTEAYYSERYGWTLRKSK